MFRIVRWIQGVETTIFSYIYMKTWITKYLAVITYIGLVSCAAPVLERHSVGQHPFVFRGDGHQISKLNYLLYLPEDYGKEKKFWPLIIYLHGASVRGNNVNKIKSYGIPLLLENRKNFPFIVISPLCPGGKNWEDTNSLLALLDDVCAEYSVDKDRIYVTGMSMGGSGTWYLAYRHPERFAAIAPLCGTADTSWVSQLKQVPVWVFHGAGDTVIPIRYSFDMVEAIIASGGEIKYTFYPGEGHDIVTKTYNNGELYDWFLRHRRNDSSKAERK